MARIRLTTFDNPYNPFTDYAKWHNFDCLHHYNTAEYVSRIAMTSEQLSDYENEQEIERAINEIIELDPFNMYRRFSEDEDVKVNENGTIEFVSKSVKNSGA